MMKNVKKITAIACLTASFAAFAEDAKPGDYAVMTCKTANMLVSSFSASHPTEVDPSKGCAPTLKALTAESMHILSTETTSDAVIYTFGFFQPYQPS